MTPGILHGEGKNARCHFFKCGMVQRHRRRLPWERYCETSKKVLRADPNRANPRTNATTPAAAAISIAISTPMTIITPCNASASEITAPVTASDPSGMSVLAAASPCNLDNAGGRRGL